MKIEAFGGVANTFTFQHNPKKIDIPMDMDHQVKHVPYKDYNILIAAGGIMPKALILEGHFNGTTKDTNYQSLQKHFRQDQRLKKMYWDADKFFFGVGKQCKKTHHGGRTSFVDYVAVFDCVVAIKFDDTLNTSGTNDGNINTFVETVLGTYDGSGNVTMTDGLGNSIQLASTLFSGTEKVIYMMYVMVSAGGGIFVGKAGYVGIEVDSGTTTSDTSYKLVQTGQNFSTTVNVGDLVYNTTDNTWTTVTKVDSNTTLSLEDDVMDNNEAFVIYHQCKSVELAGGNDGVLRLREGANITSIVTTNLTSVTKKFRDGWTD